jgi:hypothetical protein
MAAADFDEKDLPAQPLVAPSQQEQDMSADNRLPVMPAAPPERPRPGILDTLAAAERNQNLAGTLADHFENPNPNAPAIEGFDALDHVPAGYQHFASNFVNADSPQEIEHIRQQIDRELSDKQTLDDAGPWGIAATVFAGLTDPLTLASMLLPFGGATRATQAIKLAAVSGVSAAGQEGVMQALQETRSHTDSLVTIGASTIMGGILGAILRPKIPLGIQDELADRLHAELRGTGETVLGPIDGRGSVSPMTHTEAKMLPGFVDESIKRFPDQEGYTFFEGINPAETATLEKRAISAAVGEKSAPAVEAAIQRGDIKASEITAAAQAKDIQSEVEDVWQDAHEQFGSGVVQEVGTNVAPSPEESSEKALLKVAADHPITPAEGNQVVSTATGRQIEVRPHLTELKDLVSSDMPEYPKELQPRQRGDRAALEEQVQTISRGLNPERLGMSAEADRGSPIIGSDRVVESGNGRVQALRDVYENNEVKAQAYKNYLTKQGYDVSRYDQPVLVRERVTPLEDGERRAFTVEANQSSIAAMSPVERAGADAMHLDQQMLDNLAGDDLTTARNSQFVRDFMAKIPQSERNELLSADGTLNQAGVRRIQAAIMAKAYGGDEASNAALGRMLESTDDNVRSASRGMMEAAPKFAKLRQAIADGKVATTFDISKYLTQALEEIGKVRASGQSMNEYLAQGQLLGKRPPIVESLMRAMYNDAGSRLAGQTRIAERLSQYADDALKQRLDQHDMLGGTQATPDSLLAGRAEAPTLRQGTDMFGLRTPQGRLPDPPLTLAAPAEDSYPVNLSGESTAGAQAFHGEMTPTLRGDAIATGAQTYDKLTGWVAPASRLMRSPNLMVRRITEEMVNMPNMLEKNYWGQKTAGLTGQGPIERELWKTDGQHWQAIEARKAEYAAYAERMHKAGSPVMDDKAFGEKVAQAMRRGDESDIPEVAAAAKKSRDIVINPWTSRAQAVGALPSDLKTQYAKSYLMRQYDQEKIHANSQGFVTDIANGFLARDPTMDRAEARDIAYKAMDNIRGGEYGTMDWGATDGIVPNSGRFKGRTISLPDTYLEKWLNNDINGVEHSFLRTIAPEVLFRERFGDRDLGGALNDARDQYHILQERAPDQNTRTDLLDRQKDDERDLTALRDRLYGIYGQPKDPGSAGVRIGRMWRSVNGTRLLGSAAISHAPDLANVMMRYGAPKTFEGIGKFIASSAVRDMAMNDAKRTGAALDMYMNTTAAMLGDYINHSAWKPQQIMNRVMRGFTIATGETPLITMTQGVTSMLAEDEMIRTAGKIAAGKNISQGVEARLAAAGIDRDMLGRIGQQYNQFGAQIRGINFGMSDKWTDLPAREAFESAMVREAHSVTLRPGVGDTPLFMSTEWGKTMMQFKTFGFSASRSVTAPLLQGIAHGDPRAAQALLSLITMGTLSYVVKQKVAGQPIEPFSSPKFAMEVLDKSNLLGWTGDALFPIANQLGFSNVSRFSDRDPMETLGGPTAGTAGDAFTRMLPGRALAPIRNAMQLNQDGKEAEGFRRSDLHFIRKLIPGQNHWLLRNGLNHLEDTIGDAFDLPGKSQAQQAEDRAVAGNAQ